MCWDRSVRVCVFSLGKSRYLDKWAGSSCEALCEGRECYWDSPGSVALIINLLLMKSRLMQCRSTANEDIKSGEREGGNESHLPSSDNIKAGLISFSCAAA